MSAVALYHRTSLRVIDLFKFGLDTVEIADRLGISEAEALKELTIQRSQKRLWISHTSMILRPVRRGEFVATALEAWRRVGP